METIIKGHIKRYVKRILSTVSDVFVGQETFREQVESLIKSLHPYHTNTELIRIGPNGDGGYLVPNDLKNIQACFSPGVDKISEFELGCLNHGMQIFLADKSVDKVNLDISPDKYDFIKKYVGCTNNDDFITMDEWVNSKLPHSNSDLLLQMDIEGGEYNTLISTSDRLMKRFRIIVIEFHELDKLWNKEFFQFAETAFNKILQTHSCVHIHPNNCSPIHYRKEIAIPKVAEFTFLRNDSASFDKFQNHFPHKLDYDNTTNNHFALPKDWYKS